FIVITKGASRVAEVSARFTLDAMPGKQMAIDADLNAGSISEEEARRRREEISQESDFFGAMDGASKFVRGDAIAGIVITFVNICAGFVIGVMQQGMSLVEAAQNYTILTIGDGLVSQIPALIISTAAGMLVSRTGGTSDLGSELSKQLTFKPRAIWVVSGILLLFAIIPGLPFLPFLFLSLVLGALGFSLTRKQKRVKETSEEEEVPQQVQQEENYEDMLTVDLLELEVGYGLVPFVDASQNGELLDRIRSIRKQFVQSHGLIIPPIHIKDNLQLNPNQYALHLKGVRIATAEIMPGHFLAMDPGTASEKMEGTETTEPAFGLPALWVAEEKKERAQIAGYTVVDCTTVMATHLSELIKRHAHELLGRQEVQNLLDTTAKSYPKLVEELVPNLMSLGGVMRVLQNLLREEVSIRDMRTILETLADHAPKTQDEDLLTEYVRQALARQISNRAAGENSLLPVITLDTELEETIQKSVQYSGQGSYLALEPRTAERLLTSLSEQIKQSGSGTHPVLLCAPNIRPHVKRLTEQYLPQLPVLSYNEITPQLQIQSLGTVQINAS
ncbi:MAG: flagellar biosynthesis protein FlhA, partial [Desulfohalobiaceae bacterium]|nr:flagellar biosynthesis protein FlhA [Desulfohalobiaceae bacterium]